MKAIIEFFDIDFFRKKRALTFFIIWIVFVVGMVVEFIYAIITGFSPIMLIVINGTVMLMLVSAVTLIVLINE